MTRRAGRFGAVSAALLTVVVRGREGAGRGAAARDAAGAAFVACRGAALRGAAA